MMILLSICLLAQPTTCREDRINLSYESTNPFLCLRHSQSALANWQAAHPEWHVERWRCAPRGSLPKDL
ncbi:hypothetical protein [Methylobacterium oxalidis]|uniref:Uncharacterized protein n=1 Tax=Methylobacterium oxalidis TaxID=944322 RepID=A0A512J4F2_9HYPH|nr:hypothetical protein [Methylobacterium oxalidis]GEP04846.1 hypothetical protein MOX02_28840 [Methylobacterium oxalidis]GLS66977.1 hypothetical protein GCM10007888_53600 [Methylobacterium oxalidis]